MSIQVGGCYFAAMAGCGCYRGTVVAVGPGGVGAHGKQYIVDVNEYTFSGTAAVMAYRSYYRAEKRGYWRKSRDPAKPSTWVPAKWTKRDPPEWF